MSPDEPDILETVRAREASAAGEGGDDGDGADDGDRDKLFREAAEVVHPAPAGIDVAAAAAARGSATGARRGSSTSSQTPACSDRQTARSRARCCAGSRTWIASAARRASEDPASGIARQSSGAALAIASPIAAQESRRAHRPAWSPRLAATDSVYPFQPPIGAPMRTAAPPRYRLSLLRDAGPRRSACARSRCRRRSSAACATWLIAERRTGSAVPTTDSLWLTRAELTPVRWVGTIEPDAARGVVRARLDLRCAPELRRPVVVRRADAAGRARDAGDDGADPASCCPFARATVRPRRCCSSTWAHRARFPPRSRWSARSASALRPATPIAGWSWLRAGAMEERLWVAKGTTARGADEQHVDGGR